MARIPVEVVERLKTEVSVQRLAEARGVVLEKRGADLHGRCLRDRLGDEGRGRELPPCSGTPGH